MATKVSSGAARRADRAAQGTQTKSIEETLADFYEAMALAVEHPDCPPFVAMHIHEFTQEVTIAAENINAAAVEAARLRNLLPAAVSILSVGDQALRGLKAA